MEIKLKRKIFKLLVSLFIIFKSVHIFAQTITIDLNTEYQTIAGFGGMSHTTWIRDLDEDSREKAFGNDPGKIGLSILRIHLDPNPGLFNLELATAKHAISKGAIVFATPWNAPGALLDPANLSRVDPSKYGGYVNHLNSFNKYMKDNGAPLFAVSVQNEPDFGGWTRWTSPEMLDFLRNHAQNIENTVMAPESFQFRRTFTDPLLNDSLAASHIDIIGGHIYGGGLFDYPLAREKGKEVWMTEHLTGSDAGEVNDWSLALALATEINACMKANFNAYIWWYIRRYYSLIDEANNITQKGYVMSHFSKFIRPNAIRIAANVASAPNVDATAYKTDTSLVIVVINRNDTSVNINFTIQNGNADTLTKYTTSATKNVVNDGGISSSSGVFNSTIDAGSITTFTSYSGNAGKNGNIPPVVDLGSDIELGDTSGKGTVTVRFNSLYGNDPDGEIVNYNWSMNNLSLGNADSLLLNAGIGEHQLILTVTDNDGATGSDTINISIKSLYNTEIWLEAECGEVGQVWETNTDGRASNDLYINAPAGVESLSAASTNPEYQVTYTFYISETGFYKVWGRVICPNANDDSFWVKMNNGSWTIWNGIPAGSDWHWDDVHDQTPESPVIYTLETGYHTLSLCFREDGALLDKLYITNTGITPSGDGGEAENCLLDDMEFGLNNKDCQVFPNPAKNEINITSDFKFHTIHVFNVDGRKVYHVHFDTAIQDTTLKIDFPQGVYVLAISDGIILKMKKLIIE